MFDPGDLTNDSIFKNSKMVHNLMYSIRDVRVLKQPWYRWRLCDWLHIHFFHPCLFIFAFRMYGLFQTSFYFGYMALFSIALGIQCGKYMDNFFISGWSIYLLMDSYLWIYAMLYQWRIQEFWIGGIPPMRMPKAHRQKWKMFLCRWYLASGTKI